jgi:UDP-N-acetylglucosamine 2-epimerase (non-hydrolysing)
VTRGTNRIVGTDPEAIYQSWRAVADGKWPVGELPELWDGKAAGRIVRVLLGKER